MHGKLNLCLDMLFQNYLSAIFACLRKLIPTLIFCNVRYKDMYVHEQNVQENVPDVFHKRESCQEESKDKEEG